jgi:hypothetical protein
VTWVAHQLGHANPSITLKIYAHLFDAAAHEEKVAAGLESARRGENQRKTAAATGGEPTTRTRRPTWLFIPQPRLAAISGERLRTPVTPEVAGSSPVAPAPSFPRKHAYSPRCRVALQEQRGGQ